VIGRRHLTSGWEPDIAIDDTLLRHAVVALAAVNTDIARAMGGRVLEYEGAVAADLGVPNAIFNAAVLTRPPDEGGWPGILDALDGFYANGTGGIFLFSPWPTPDLGARGWELEGHPPLLVRPPGLPAPSVPCDLDIREVTDPQTLEDLERVIVDGFPFEEHQPFDPGAWLDERVLDLPDHRMFVGYADGEAVAAGWLLLYAGLGVPILGATLPHARNRGYWTAMLSRRLRAAERSPVASLFSDMSRPGAERCGFLPVTRFTVWSRERTS
jgi:hypothetical protein